MRRKVTNESIETCLDWLQVTSDFLELLSKRGDLLLVTFSQFWICMMCDWDKLDGSEMELKEAIKVFMNLILRLGKNSCDNLLLFPVDNNFACELTDF